MANNFFRSAANLTNEALVKPVKDEVGKALEEGIQSTTGVKINPVPQDPQEEAKKKTEEAQKRQRVMQFLSQYRTDEQFFRQKKQEEEQKKQQENQDDQQKMQVKQFEVQRRQESLAVTQAKTRAETKGGVGG